MHFREIRTASETVVAPTHNLHNTEEYPPHEMSRKESSGLPGAHHYPIPPSQRTSTTLLPGNFLISIYVREWFRLILIALFSHFKVKRIQNNQQNQLPVYRMSSTTETISGWLWIPQLPPAALSISLNSLNPKILNTAKVIHLRLRYILNNIMLSLNNDDEVVWIVRQRWLFLQVDSIFFSKPNFFYLFWNIC